MLESSIPKKLVKKGIPTEKKDIARILKSKIIRQKLDRNSSSSWLTFSLLGATEFGFVDNQLRRQCWTRLLNKQMVGNRDTRGEMKLIDPDDESLPKDANQVHLDVKRSFGYLKDTEQKVELKKVLEYVIINVLRRNPALRYYQGYHDIASVFVMVFNDNQNILSNLNEIIRLLEVFTLIYLRDFMMDSLSFAIDQIKIIPLLLMKHNKTLVHKLKLHQQDPFFAISSILTLYSHHFKPHVNSAENPLIYEIFDLIISTQSMVLPLEMYCKFLLLNKDALYKEYEFNSPHFDNTNDLVHVTVQKVIVSSLVTSGDDNMTICQQWWDILREVRNDFVNNKIKIPSLKKHVNKYSPLVTTATNTCLKSFHLHEYQEDELRRLLSQAIKLNRIRKSMSNGEQINKLYRQQNYPFLVKILEDKCSSLTPLMRVSVMIGILALLIRIMDKDQRTLHRVQNIMYGYLASTLGRIL